ncbi:MAG: hypothetical protein KAJ49_05985 [Arcobacteraceae bacterium]|nr:hypothetical protein [Arcobacteraceae bacterium]
MTKRKTTLKRKIKARVPQQKVYTKDRAYHLAIDRRIPAKRVGWRMKNGKRWYFERRENRSDVSKKKQL